MTNYLADPGTSFSLNSTISYSFNLAAGQTAVIVVDEVNPNGCLGCNYTLTYGGPTKRSPRSYATRRTGSGRCVSPSRRATVFDAKPEF